MISTAGVSLSFGSRKLFEDVNIKFVPGNCYGLIGANGAGKSTFLKMLSGEITSYKGTITVTPGERISFLRQDHFTFDDVEVLKTVILGQPQLSQVIADREALYAKTDLTDADGVRAGELEGLFADMNGWEAESDAAVLLAGLGIGTELHAKKMRELRDTEKVKVLLAQALFGKPDILLLDEPTNHLDHRRDSLARGISRRLRQNRDRRFARSALPQSSLHSHGGYRFRKDPALHRQLRLLVRSKPARA